MFCVCVCGAGDRSKMAAVFLAPQQPIRRLLVSPKIVYRTKGHTSLSKPLCLYVNKQDLRD